MRSSILTLLALLPLFASAFHNNRSEVNSNLELHIDDILTKREVWAKKDPRGLFWVDTLPYSELVKFEAKKLKEGIEITWETSRESNLDYYDLQRSIDGKDYESIYQVKATGTTDHVSSYKYLDEKVYDLVKDATHVYYQLYQVGLSEDVDNIGTTFLALTSTPAPDDITDLIPQITPKSPNVTAMERYGTYPVSLYTGLPQIDIPIYDIKVGDLTIPVKLSYHAGGNKVLDNASWVGMGWTITGLYSVTREVRGLVDENGGIFDEPMPNFPTPSPSCLTEALKDSLNQHILFDRDVERDVFTYRTPMRSNSFVLLPDSVLFLESDKSILTHTQSPNLLNEVLLTDEYGNRYTYAAREFTNVSSSSQFNGTTAWHLTKLQSSRAGEDVVYTYQDTTSLQYPSEITHYRVWHTNVCTGAPVMPGPQTPGVITNTAFVKSRNPKEIFFPGGKIVFVEEGSPRMDGLGKACDKIEIYGYDFSGAGGYTKIRTYDLDFVYKTRSGSSEKVLFLDKVRMLDATGSEVGRYTLEYNSEALPARTSLQKDHWGYKNAASSNTSLIPNQTVNYQPTCNPGNSSTVLTGGNREVDTIKMQAWILTKINYPTGGYTSFTYEAHRYLDSSTPVLVGGLRIKSQVSNDANGKTITRRYKYGVGENGYGTDRDLSSKTLITDQLIKTINAPSPPTTWSYNIHTLAAGVNTILNPFESVPVTYAKVTEYEDINGAGTNGRTVYTFKDNAHDDLISTNTTMRQVLQSEHWNRGQLLSKVVYGSDTRMKSKEVNAYRPIVSLTESETLGYVFGRSEVRMNPGPPDGQGCLQNDDLYVPIQKYNWKTGLVKLDTIKTWQYDDEDDSKSVFQKTEMTYDPNWYQVKEIRKYNTDGYARIQRFRYCTDLSNLSSGLTGQAKAFYQLKANNQLHTPIEVLRLHKKGASAATVLGGTLTLFRSHSLSSYQYVLPDEVYQAKIDGFYGLIESSFSPVNVNGSGALTKFNRYQLRLEYDSYTTAGRLASFHRTAGSTTSYSHQSVLNQVYHHRLQSETRNVGSSNALTTTYSIDMPIVGVNQITAPNALKTYFEYDDYGRLQRIKDDNQDIIKEHGYQYSTSGNNYIQEFVPRIAQSSLTGDHTSFETITHFYDGLGRPLQDLHYKGSPDGVNNLITNAMTYDNYDRAEYRYVPFHASGVATSKANLPGVVHGDSKPYTRFKEYDNSPLNRETKIVGPGNTWHTQNKQTEIQYLVAPAGRVRKYQSGIVSVTVEGSYGANELLMRKTISEQGNEVIEFFDNDGKLIQKDEQDGSGSYRKTAYIYNEWDRLKYVIQPESFKDSVDFTNNDTYFQKGVFSYVYDSLGRTVNLHVPGAGWTYHVHDRLDQMVLTQTELQRSANKWSFNRFDAFGRVAESGEVVIPSQTPVQLRNAFNTHGTAFEQFNSGTGLYNHASYPTLSGANFDLRTRNIFDYYGAYVTGYAFTSSHAYETNYTNARGWLTYVLEWDSRDKNQYYTVFHYDDKGRIIQTKKSHHLGGSSPGNKPVITSFKLNFPGQTIAQKTTYQFDQLSSVTQIDSFKYDHKGRLLEYSNGTNQTASQICTTAYDQTGRLITKVYLPGGSFTTGGIQDYIYRPPSPSETNTADTARQGIILDAGTEIDVSLINTYQAVIDSTLTDPNSITNLQTINYSYNIRDWLTGINLDANSNPNPNNGQGDLFSLKLFYENNSRYDGTLGKQTWTIAADAQNPQQQRSYTYTYDPSSQLKKAAYTGVNGENFTVDSLKYDKNGNIKKLWRYGLKGSSYGFVDKLDYTYNGNHLTQVEDAETGDHKVDFHNRVTQANEYEYYNDGSLKKDLNENISQIDYDTHLKLPIQVTLTTGDWIKYTYDGQGRLIRRELSSGIIWDYIDGMILKDNQPYQIAMPEGRVIYEEETWRNEFEYRDNVGNLRLAFTKRNGSLQKTLVSDYTPFGIPINQKVYTPNPCNYTFHSHEDQGDFDLRMMNMGARCYNQTIGRFLGNDAFSASAPSWTGYRLGWNQPQNVNDPTGNYEYTDGYGTWDNATVAGSPVIYGNLEIPPGQSGDEAERQINNTSDPCPECPTATLPVVVVSATSISNKSKGSTSIAYTIPLVIAQFDSPLPGPADAVALFVAAGIYLSSQLHPPRYTTLFKKVGTNAEADRAAREWGYEDAHDLKKDHDVGSEYDIYRDGKTGNGELRPKKGRPGENKPIYPKK